MDISNKSFKNNLTGEIVKVIDSFENIAILENKTKTEVSQLTNPVLYTEQIDVSNFFNTQGAYNSLADKIKNIPLDKIRDIPNDMNNSEVFSKPVVNESAIIMTTEEDERAELARKYGVNSNKNEIVRQNEAFNKILNPESEQVQKVVVSRDNQSPEPTQTVYVKPQEDPIITMFKNVKRSKDFSISLEIKNKIPRPDFIEMMEDSYTTSIIDFLAEELTDNILRNPKVIENMIRTKIKEIVYGAEIKIKENSQITDSVTQTSKKEINTKKKKEAPKTTVSKPTVSKPTVSKPKDIEAEKEIITKIVPKVKQLTGPSLEEQQSKISEISKFLAGKAKKGETNP